MERPSCKPGALQLSGDNPGGLLNFKNTVIALLDYEELLSYALPALREYFQTRCQTRFNLRLGTYMPSPGSGSGREALLWFAPQGYARGFPARYNRQEVWLEPNTTELPALAFKRNRALFAPEADAPPAPIPPDGSLTLKLLEAPLWANRQKNPEPLAVLEIEAETPVELDFWPELAQALHIFGCALGNAARYAEAQKTIRQLKALQANTADLVTQPQLRPILELTVHRAIKLLGGTGGTFFILDHANQEVECIIDNNTGLHLSGQRYKFGQSMAGFIAVSGEPLIVDDYSRWSGRTPLIGDNSDFRAAVGVPVYWKDEMIGTLVVLNTTPSQAYTQQDADLLALFAGQAAAAISNTRLLEATLRATRELEMVYQAAALVSGNVQLRGLCEAFVSELVDRFGYKCTFIYVKEDDGQIRIQAQRGFDKYLVVLNDKEGICGRVVRTRQSQLVRDAAKERDFIYVIDNVKSGVYVPVLQDEELLGVIGVEEINRQLDEADLRLLEALSHQLSIAIKNAWLFERAASQAAELSQRNQELEAILDGMNKGLLIEGLVGGVRQLKVNKEGLKLIGWGDSQPSQAELIDPQAYQVYLPVAGSRSIYGYGELPAVGRQISAAEWPTARVFRGERFSGYELLLTGPDNQPRLLSFAGAPIYNEQREVSQAIIVFHDVTALRTLEEMKDAFLTLVSHDLRAPLGAIAGYAEQALSLLESGPDQDLRSVRHGLEVITRHSQRLNRLVSDLLEMAQLESGVFEFDMYPYNLGLLVNEICAFLNESIPDLAGTQPDPAHPRRPYLRLDLDRTLPPVMLDQVRFERVLTNLISNAVKYSHNGGEILVELRINPDDPGAARLKIQDNGIGVEPDKIPNLFTRFFRTEQARSGGYSGTGLGLYICNLLIQTHKGRIWAESQGPGQGSTFYVSLPFAPATVN